MKTGPKRVPLGIRFWQFVYPDPNTGCWLWGGATYCGYGRVSAGGAKARTLVAHRVAYELLVGPIPVGLTLDHLCRVHECVNPTHLEPVTQRVNTLRGTGSGARAIRTGQCHRGHAFSPENTRIDIKKSDGIPFRVCRACARTRSGSRRQRVRAADIDTTPQAPSGRTERPCVLRWLSREKE